MSFTNNDQVFHTISEQELAEIISYGLRKDHGRQGSSVKQIARKVGLNPRLVRNWYEARNIPNLSNFLCLAGRSPTLMKSFLELSGYGEIAKYLRAPKLPTNHADKNNYGDNSVTINVSLSRNILLKLNQRQFWFYGFLQKGLSLKAEDVANVWEVNIRTAKRDIAGLIDLDLIKFLGAHKNGQYIQT